MNKREKELVVGVLRDKFDKSQGSFVVNVKGLTVNQTQQLRAQLRDQGGELKIAKVRLVKRAVSHAAYGQQLGASLKDQVGVVFAHKEYSPVAKVLYGFSKQCEAFKLVAGCVDDEVLDSKGVVVIASLPSKEVLLARLCGVLKAPVVKLLLALKQIQEQKTSSVVE